MVDKGSDGMDELAQSSRFSIRPQKTGMSNLSDRPHTGSPNSKRHEYSQFGARGGKFSEAKPKSDVDWAIHRAKQCPGPGQYKINRDLSSRGGRFNMSNPKSDIEWMILNAKKTPGPGDYRVTEENVIGGKFGSAISKSSLDRTIFDARDKPGPGQYNPDAHYKVNGGRFSNSKLKSNVDWSIERAKKVPGPGEYKVTDIRLPGGKFNQSNPKSDVDWAILKSSKLPSPQDYLPGSSHIAKTKGGAFGKAVAKTDLDLVIRLAQEMPGPGEYNAELHELSRRTGSKSYVPSETTMPLEERPKSGLARFGPGIPPEARRKPKPKATNENSYDSRYSSRSDTPKRPSTSLGIPSRRPLTASSTSSSLTGGKPAYKQMSKVQPRSTSAPPGPRPAPNFQNESDSRAETRPSSGAQERRQVHVSMPREQTESKKNNVFVGGNPTVYTLPDSSSRPASVIAAPKTKAFSSQICDEDFRVMARAQEAEEKAQKKALMQGNASKNSATSRPASSLSRSSASTGRPMSGASRMSGFSVEMMTATPIHTSKRIPKKDKNKVVYPPMDTQSAALSSTRGKLSDNARKLFDLAMQSNEFKKMMELYTGVKDPSDVIEKYAAMWSYQPLFETARPKSSSRH